MKTITLSNSNQLPYNFTGSVEYLNISKCWYKKGKLHREDGPAVERVDGDKYWYKEDKLHREDGPAVELVRGQKEWYKEGKLHRIDGPAVEWGLVTAEWWIDGEQLVSITDITGKLYLGKEKGKYGLEWLKFLTKESIEEIPIVPGFKQTLVQYFSIEEYVSHHKRIKNENE